MIAVGICDDEAQMRKTLRQPLERTLQLLGQEYRIFEYSSGEELLKRHRKERLDILFLDVEMKGINGMETAGALRKEGAGMLFIFVTAFPDYVFQGYEVHAFHYILKPYKEQKIAEVLEQAVKELDSHAERYFIVEQKAGSRRIPVSRVIAFCSNGRKLTIIMNEEEIEFYGKLDEVCKSLPDYFVRIHNRFLINLNYITAVEKDSLLCTDRKFPISRAYKQPLEVAFARALLQ